MSHLRLAATLVVEAWQGNGALPKAVEILTKELLVDREESRRRTRRKRAQQSRIARYDDVEHPVE